MRSLPNIVFITTDQHRADTLGCAGHPAVRTPNLDALAARGIRYETAICQAPVCTPNRACWVTGQYLGTHGVWANGVPLPDGPDLLPHCCRRAGYSTAMVGKLHLTPSMSPNQPGDGAFGYDLVRLTEGDQPGGYRHWLRQTAPDQYDRLHHGFPPQRLADLYEPEEGLPEELHSTHWVTETALGAWRRRVQHKPLFMHVSYPDPHHAFEAPRRFVDRVPSDRLPEPIPPPTDWTALPPHFRRFREGGHPLIPQRLDSIDADLIRRVRRTYCAMVDFLDEGIGRLLEVVLADDPEALVIFTADHGELLGDHGLLYKGLFHYDSLLRVPLIVSGGGLPAGLVLSQPVQSIDLMPTILQYAGLGIPRACQGTVLPGVGRPPTARPYVATLTEQRGPWYEPEMRAVTLRTEEWKLSVYDPPTAGELYDLCADPDECRNLWDVPEYREQREAMFRQLACRLLATAPPGHARVHRA